eukprot:comp13108_c0_seq1/m.17770 comp13108_c0_seq1/g.17770  ORF comp13108_c0_seq1/g.17770 comp13108_c0_seq1/m.17770 type:complete len:628 (+) comp13108_c0_seq1:985-2868(+)
MAHVPAPVQRTRNRNRANNHHTNKQRVQELEEELAIILVRILETLGLHKVVVTAKQAQNLIHHAQNLGRTLPKHLSNTSNLLQRHDEADKFPKMPLLLQRASGKRKQKPHQNIKQNEKPKIFRRWTLMARFRGRLVEPARTRGTVLARVSRGTRRRLAANTGLGRTAPVHIPRGLAGRPVAVARPHAVPAGALGALGALKTVHALAIGAWLRAVVRVVECLDLGSVRRRVAVHNPQVLVPGEQRRSSEIEHNHIRRIPVRKRLAALRDPFRIDDPGTIVLLAGVQPNGSAAKELVEHTLCPGEHRCFFEPQIEMGVKVAPNNSNLRARERDNLWLDQVNDRARFVRNKMEVGHRTVVVGRIVAGNLKLDKHRNIAIAQIIQNTRDRQRLWDIPVRGREKHRVRADLAFGLVAVRNLDRHRILRLSLSSHHKAARVSGVLHHTSIARPDTDRFDIAVGRHGPKVLAAARGRPARDRVLHTVAKETTRRCALHTIHEIARKRIAGHSKHRNHKVQLGPRRNRPLRWNRTGGDIRTDPGGLGARNTSNRNRLVGLDFAKEITKQRHNRAASKVNHTRVHGPNHGLWRNKRELDRRATVAAALRRWNHIILHGHLGLARHACCRCGREPCK